MYVHSVKLINFKSFGDYPGNEVILEPRITAIIGKNESGKSNVLDGLSRIHYIGRNPNAFNADAINRKCPPGAENKYIITLKPVGDDFDLGIEGDVIIEITKNGFVLTGGFLPSYNLVVKPSVDNLLSILGARSENPLQLRDTDLTNYRTYYGELCAEDKIDVPRRTAALRFIEKNADRIAKDKQEELKQAVGKAYSNWLTLTSTIPVMFYRNGNKHLNTTYKYEEIEKELASPNSYPNSLLSELVKAIEVAPEEFLLASRSGISPHQESIRRTINRCISQKINAKFKNFYQTEEVYLDLSFNNGTISFAVQTNEGSALMLSERSNGLRWYLETYIDMLANDVLGRNIVFLLDEPGVSLHVNAQKELLNLFGHLANQGNQVVYSTHSPYMLDLVSEGIHRIRAVVKDNEGYSHIFKSAYDAKISPASQKDTLAPIITALGMNLNDTFGPAMDKINIVTEGMSDYIFLCTMAKHLAIDTNKFVILPSVGASNCVRLCQILHGWGCKYIALFDYDRAGVESGGELMRKDLLFEYGKQYCYVRDITAEEIAHKTYVTDPFMIEDVMNKSEIDRFLDETGTSKELGKPLTAKLMCTAIENRLFTVSAESENNFRTLFDKITDITS